MRRTLWYLPALALVVAWFIGSTTINQPMQATSAKTVADPGQVGPYAIGHTNFMLYDATRPGNREGEASFNEVSRPIPVSVWYPVDPSTVAGRASDAEYPLDPLYGIAPVTYSADWERYGIDPAFEEPVPSHEKPFPLVVFSPGWGWPTWQYTSIATRLASHGFVVAVMYHWGDQWFVWEPPYDPLAVASYNRPRDVSFVLDDVLARNATSTDLLHGLIRPDQVAVSGHSLGGYATMVMAGGDDSVCDMVPAEMGPVPGWTCAPSAPDPRFKVILPLDGSNQLLHFSELARVTVPAMGIGEEWNAVLDWQARAHAAYSGHPAYRVDVMNTVHLTFSDICEAGHVYNDIGFDPGFAEWMVSVCTPDVLPSGLTHQLTSKYMVAFLKTQLAGESGYQNMLTPGWTLTREQFIEFFVTEKRSAQSIEDDYPSLFTYFPHQPGSAQARGVKDPHKGRPVARPGGRH